MRKMTQVSILYMVGALLFAQPILSNLSCADDSLKYNITAGDCIKAAIGGVALVAVVYAVWKIKNIEKAKEEYADESDNNISKAVPKWVKDPSSWSPIPKNESQPNQK